MSHYMNPSDLDPEAVTDGVREAFLTVLTTGGGFGLDYPISRDEMHAAITEGVREAIDQIDLTAAISEGVREAIGDWLRTVKPNPNDDTVHRHT